MGEFTRMSECHAGQPAARNMVTQPAATEANISRIVNFLPQGLPFGALSAFQRDDAPEVNLARTHELGLAIRSMNLGFVRLLGVLGRDDHPRHREILVVAGTATMAEAMFRTAMIRLGADHGGKPVLLRSSDGSFQVVANGGTMQPRPFSFDGLEEILGLWLGGPFSIQSVEDGFRAMTHLGFGARFGIDAARRQYGTEKQLPVPTNTERITAHLESHTPFAILTASRPNLPLHENRVFIKRLAGQLRALNLGYVTIQGAFSQPGLKADRRIPEELLVVLGSPSFLEAQFRSAMANLGRAYHQESILLGSRDKVVEAVPTYGGKGLPLGTFSETRIGEMISEWKGRPFAFTGFGAGELMVETRMMNISQHLIVREMRRRISHDPSTQLP